MDGREYKPPRFITFSYDVPNYQAVGDIRLARDDLIELEGNVIDVLSGGIYKVQIGEERIIQAKISGKLRKFNIKVMMGDMVKVSVSPYDLTHGLITFRERIQRRPGPPRR